MAGGVCGRRGHAWWKGMCVGVWAYMAGAHVWQGACMAGGMCGGSHVWQGGIHGRGHTWQGGIHGRGYAWQGGMHGRHHEIRSMSGWYVSSWNAFLFNSKATSNTNWCLRESLRNKTGVYVFMFKNQLEFTCVNSCTENLSSVKSCR